MIDSLNLACVYMTYIKMIINYYHLEMNEFSSVSKDIFSTEEETQSSNVDSSSQYNKETEEEEVLVEENDYENEDDNENENENEPGLDDEPFYFESDTLALRNNPDYSCLMKTLILLEGQRVKAINDLEKLYDMKEAALKEPIRFVKGLNGENNLLKDTPARQKIYCLPEIDWNKYYDCVDVNDLDDIKNQHKNRTQSLRQASKLIQQKQLNESTIESPTTSSRASARQQKAADAAAADDDKEKTANYNKSWSVDEQRKLEELLIEFPPEDNEAARWRKIATKLGTRTPLQVQSHCQKYFIKLAKAGLPIPGRMPNLKTYVTKKGTRGRARGACMASIGGGRASVMYQDSNRKTVGRGVNLNEMSSMWSSFNPPIVMNDENDLADSNFDCD